MRKYAGMLFATLLVLSSNAFANTFTYSVSAETEQQARMAAIREGTRLCREAGYRFADVEIVQMTGSAPSPFPVDVLAIATCIE